MLVKSSQQTNMKPTAVAQWLTTNKNTRPGTAPDTRRGR